MVYSAFIEIVACTAAASFHFAGGACVAFSAILIPQLESPESDIKVTKEDISWIVSIVALVMPVSALFTGYLVDKIGRLNTIRAGAVPYVLGWVCIALAQDLKMMLIGRFLNGLSMALACNPAVVYITEVSRADFRGALICLAPSLTSMGMVVVYAQGAFLHWRTISWLAASYCVLPILIMTLWSPESPVWLLSVGKTDQALKSLSYLCRKDKKAGAAERQLVELQKQQNKSEDRTEQHRSVLGNLFPALAKPTGYKPLLILTAVFAFQQCSGIYITIFYTVSFFERVGTSIDPYISTVGVGVVRLVMGLITSVLLRNFGRRPLFIASCTGMAIFSLTAGYFTKEITQGNMKENLIPVVSILIYISIGVFGLMSIPWTMTAELFATEIRGMAQGLMMAISSLMMFAVLKVYPFLEDMVGGMYGVLWLFAGVCLCSIVFIFVFLPETHGKELTEIQEYFANNTIYILRKKPKQKSVKEEIEDEMVKLNDTSVVPTIY